MGYGLRHGILDFKREIVGGATYPTDGLIERWDFNNTLTGLNGNTWSMNNSSWEYFTTTLTGGKGIRMTTNNLNTRGTVSDSFFTGTETDFSLSGWFYLNGKSSYVGWGKGVWGTASSINNFNCANAGYAYTMGVNFGAPDVKKQNYTYDKWFHVVGTYKSSTKAVKLYIDNTLEASGTGTNVINSSGINWAIFDVGTTGFYSTTGCGIALLYIYDKELTSTEVSQLYNSGNGV